MALEKYDYMIVANPPRARREGAGEGVGHHVRLLPSSTVAEEDLVEKMHELESVMSRGALHTALAALEGALAELLAGGHAVSIPGIGTVRPRLAGEVVETAAGLAARNVRVSELQFVADEGLLARINEGRPTLRRRGARQMPSQEEVTTFLDSYFARHEKLTRKAVVEHFGMTKYQALQLLTGLTERGTLVRRGSRATACYERAF